jgi:enamine deaminase RidA (YjgF/YER057c/UK114 family)
VTVEENIRKLGLELPDPPAPVGAYVTWVRTGNLIVTSGQLPWSHKTMLWPGRLGEKVSVEDGYKAARQAGLNGIAQLKAAAGDLEKIHQIVRLEGYVHCAPGFRDHPKVLDGASDLMLAVFGDRGKHVRIALGIPDMPLNACVQISFWAEVE